MLKLHLFIDGSWLFRACGADKALAAATEWPDQAFRLDFDKLNQALLDHAAQAHPECRELGGLYLSTSVFALPENFSTWPEEYPEVNAQDVVALRKSVSARDIFAKRAVAAGYSPDAIYHPKLKPWMVEKLRNRQFQEKQVDATVVALLVRSAILCPEDVHAVVTGDADILPALKLAYPQYSRNLFIATVHPDELLAERRQTSFSLQNFDFQIPPYYLQDHADRLLHGDFVSRCAHCHKAFARTRPMPPGRRPCCKPCNDKRT